MNFFFDNNLPPQLAHGVAALSKNEPNVNRVEHLRDRFKGGEHDVIWLGSLADDAGPWYVISIDKFKRDHRAPSVKQSVALGTRSMYLTRNGPRSPIGQRLHGSSFGGRTFLRTPGSLRAAYTACPGTALPSLASTRRDERRVGLMMTEVIGSKTLAGFQAMVDVFAPRPAEALSDNPTFPAKTFNVSHLNEADFKGAGLRPC